MGKPNGFIIYQGPSLLDGSPIVAIAVGTARRSKNAKTGNMLQTYIIRSDVHPLDAIKSGADAAICGDCAHRGTQGKARTCYVQVGQGPSAVFKAFKRGLYPRAAADGLWLLGQARVVRLGTYGDPAAVPTNIWRALVWRAAGHTGYTHQWRTAPQLRTLVMASADSPAEAIEANRLGWRTFRVALLAHPTHLAKEITCPASSEAGRKLTCAQCLSCAGANGRKSSIVIQAHGGASVMHAVRARAVTQQWELSI